jgi:hypothetical protein
MQMSEINQSLTQLNAEAQDLMAQELDNAPGQADRAVQANRLTAQLQSLRMLVDSAPQADRSILDDLWRAAQRALIFVVASAAPVVVTQSEAERLNAEAFSLGQKVVEPNSDKAALKSQAQALREQIIKALAQPSGKESEANRLLSDAMLDAMFVLQGGVGPSSIRLGHHLHN